MKQNIKIRKAEKKDVAAISELNRLGRIYHIRLDSFYKNSLKQWKTFAKYLEKLIKKRSARVLVAETDGKIIGYCIGSVEKGKAYTIAKKIGEIDDVFVLENYRRWETGRKMVNELLSWFRKNGIKYVELSVCSKNKVGYATWCKFGFKECTKNMRLKI